MMRKILFGLGLLFTVAITPMGLWAETVAPGFTLESLAGDSVSLSSFRGKKVLVDFWASWCPPCRRELVEINEILSQHKEGDFKILCISVDQTKEAAQSYIDQMGYDFTVLHDSENGANVGKVANSYGVRGIPALFLVNEEGVVSWSNVGAVPKKTLKKVLGIS